MKKLYNFHSSYWNLNQRTHILPFDKDRLLLHLKYLTKPYNEKPSRKKDYEKYRFTGQLEKNTFRLSRTVLEPNNFLSIAEGTIEATSKGCFIQIKYKTFKFTRILIWFWGILGICMTLYFSFYKINVLYAVLIALFTLAHTTVCILSIQRQKKILEDIFDEIFNSYDEFLN
ncbi:hypothetical protein Fleli_1743 [Bernardetia litoralis DSM 6794]|uniref:Uncharacterized protein n=1 Tax=Bernardetia litoralis (strain ATCC 23117 / DSM 6794 / NBRC 15988 / NCIMB 1366 / Fx l1 / Sio-4) TaxID=880071 RepID=I4AJK7_BERLS|nr:hypothetical protein [Bernardetia litoralis]AFM04142.1 hypothetical protein Fleli_1743 [Bernardetia litoralis DSM 6794]